MAVCILGRLNIFLLQTLLEIWLIHWTTYDRKINAGYRVLQLWNSALVYILVLDVLDLLSIEYEM